MFHKQTRAVDKTSVNDKKKKNKKKKKKKKKEKKKRKRKRKIKAINESTALMND